MSQQPIKEKLEAAVMKSGPPTQAPVVFISYSHDTPAHKRWVGDLASKLMENGVEVILDQWELVLGDDVPKFMERSVSRADCVLMICTEPYVRKADDGKDGAGYEAMVVTGELVDNLGTSKFIPIIRQQDGDSARPKCVSTRFYVNLSKEADFDTGFEDLLRRIHGVPKFKKPQIGKSPFVAAGIKADPDDSAGIAADTETGKGAERFYARAAGAARKGESFAWRQLMKEVRRRGTQGLSDWRKKWEGLPPEERDDKIKMVDEAFTVVSPLFAVALAGVESGEDKLRRQIGIVDDLLYPPDWSGAGFGDIVDLPDSLVFVYQALHGAVCMQTNQLDLAVELARSHFKRIRSLKSKMFMEEKAWVGWPDSISDNCADAWNFLSALSENHPWLLELFGTKEEFIAALSSYYALLTILELANTIATGHTHVLDGRELDLSVPLCGFAIPHQTTIRAYRHLTSNAQSVRRAWEDVGVSTHTIAKYWPVWVQNCKGWLREVYGRRHQSAVLYVEDLFQQPGFKDNQERGGK